MSDDFGFEVLKRLKAETEKSRADNLNVMLFPFRELGPRGLGAFRAGYCGGPGARTLEPLLVDTIKEYLVVLSQEKDTLSTPERISEAQVARHGLPAGLMTRLKESIKTWRRAAS
jgi:hypothetical protein